MENTTDKIMTFGQSQSVAATNKWWNRQYQILKTRTDKLSSLVTELKAENENLKAKLENRDLNLEHLRSIIEEFESALN